MSTFEWRPEARRNAGLEQQQSKHEAELADIEAEIGRVKQLQTIVSGFNMSKSILAGFESSEEAVEKVEAAMNAVRELETKHDLPALLERRRQLKQLLVTGKIDLGTVGGSQE